MNPTTDFSVFAHALNRNSLLIRLNDGVIEIVFSEAGLDEYSINELQSGLFSYGLFQRDSMPVLLLGAGIFQLDCWLNIYDLVAGRSKERIAGYSGRVLFSIVSPTTYELIAQRSFVFDPCFVQHLKNVLTAQRRTYRSDSEVIAKMMELDGFLKTVSMFSLAKMYSVASQPVEVVKLER